MNKELDEKYKQFTISIEIIDNVLDTPKFLQDFIAAIDKRVADCEDPGELIIQIPVIIESIRKDLDLGNAVEELLMYMEFLFLDTLNAKFPKNMVLCAKIRAIVKLLETSRNFKRYISIQKNYKRV